MNILRRKLSSFYQLPAFIRWRLPLTWLLLGLGRLLVLTLPFRRLAPLLGGRHDAPWSPLIQPEQLAQLRAVRQLISITSQYCPWQANCFAQAITARIWLGWYNLPYVLFFGVARDPSQQLKAHAWVMSGPIAVSGGNSFQQFTVVGCYSHGD